MTPHPQSNRPKILLVDNSPTNLRVLGGILSPHYDVLAAATSDAALEIARTTEHLSLVLLDVMMPGMDGYEICRILKSDEATRQIPIIFLTATEGFNVEARGFELGAVDYITKPYSASVVRARVKNHLALKQRAHLLETSVFIDELTGIANRQQFERQLRKEWRRTMRRGVPLSLLMIDLDHFRQFNDRYGHEAGDEYLRLAGRRLADIIKRPGDLAARYDGDEFAVILPDTDEKGACTVAEAMRLAVESLSPPLESSLAANHITVSLGVACVIPNRQGDLQELVSAADHALNRAKSAGSNQVSIGRPITK
ncbi:MAG: diguanylate cyclase [Chloroflexota bacterium]